MPNRRLHSPAARPLSLLRGVAQREERLAPTLLIVVQLSVGVEPRQDLEALIDDRALPFAVRDLGELV